MKLNLRAAFALSKLYNYIYTDNSNKKSKNSKNFETKVLQICNDLINNLFKFDLV